MKQPPVGRARPGKLVARPLCATMGCLIWTHLAQRGFKCWAKPPTVAASPSTLSQHRPRRKSLLGRESQTRNTRGRKTGTPGVKGPAGPEGFWWQVVLDTPGKQRLYAQCQGTPYPLPGFLQVVAKDFPDLLFLILGQGWKDALHRKGLGVDVPAWTDRIQSDTVMATAGPNVCLTSGH